MTGPTRTTSRNVRFQRPTSTSTSVIRRVPGMFLDRAVEQFDRHALRAADEADARARPHRGRLAGELNALGLEVRRDGVDAGHRKPEMVEALIRRDWRRIDAVASLDRREEHVGAADLHVDARRTLLHGA